MIIPNDCFKSTDGSSVRLITAVSQTNIAWVIELNNPKALPVKWFYTSLQQQESLKKINKINVMNPGYQISPTAKSISRMDLAWNRIEPILKLDGIYEADKRGKIIQQRALEISCSKQTLLKDLRAYWQGGQTRDALLANFQNCGKSADGKWGSRGRKSKFLGYKTYEVTEADLKIFNQVIKKKYLKSEVETLPGAYQHMIEKNYSYVDGNGNPFISPLGEKPTLRQFIYHTHKSFSPEVFLRKRLGDGDYERDYRAKLGSAMQDCDGVGSVYEIDATIADVFLVATKDRSRIIGKPTLYLIYDRRSRLIVGFYVGLEAASWSAAMQAIICIAEDKASLCKQYGVPYNADDWPADGIFPEKFFGDRGEMLSSTSSQLSTGLAIAVVNAPSCRADRKGTVECGFKLTHGTMADVIPGYEPPRNVTKRRAKKYHLDACLTLEEFKAILLKNIITQNNKVMRSYPIPAEMLSKGIQPTPIDIWNYEAPTRIGAMTRYPEEYIRLQLMPREFTTVTPE